MRTAVRRSPTSFMPTLRATFHFRLDQLVIRRDLLGTTHALERDGRRFDLTLPLKDREPDPPRDAEGLSDVFPERPIVPDLEQPGEVEVTLSVRAAPSEEYAVVGAVRVDVLFESDVSASDFSDVPQPKESPRFEAAFELLKEAGAQARSVVEELTEWLRVEPRQRWLGLGGVAPESAGKGVLVDCDANRVLPVKASLDPDLILQPVGREQIVDESVLTAFVRRVERREYPSLGESLLADAAFLLRAEPPDPARALLVAAIASEVRVKAVLREEAPVEQKALLDVLLSNPRDWSLSAAAHFHKPMKAVTGRSLQEDDGPLWKRLEELFRRRNALAHHGERPTEGQSEAAVRTAAEVFKWLHTLSPGTRISTDEGPTAD